MATSDAVRRALEERAATTAVAPRPVGDVVAAVRRRRRRVLAPATACALLLGAAVVATTGAPPGERARRQEAAPVLRVRVRPLTDDLDLGRVVISPALPGEPRVAAADALDALPDAPRHRPVVARHGRVAADVWGVTAGTRVWVLSYTPACCPDTTRHAVVASADARYLGTVIEPDGMP
ncbi:MAG TPA: hypothetical protein VHJ34_01165 [Actinomycetota bacterium]|nr:hypothetical protein [Actinomycetota bacterium]